MPTRTSVSQASSYAEIGAFWDEHDATEFGQNDDSQFDVAIQSQCTYFALDNALSPQVRKIAQQHGISAETLLNLWMQEKLKPAR